MLLNSGLQPEKWLDYMAAWPTSNPLRGSNLPRWIALGEEKKKEGGKRCSRERPPRASRGEKWREVKKRGRGEKKKGKKKAATSFDPQARLCLFTLTAVFLSAYVWAVKRRRARNTLSIPRRRDDARIMVSLIPRRASGARTRYAYATEAGSNYRARSREPRVPRETLAPIRDLFGTIQNWDVRIFPEFFRIFKNPSLPFR